MGFTNNTITTCKPFVSSSSSSSSSFSSSTLQPEKAKADQLSSSKSAFRRLCQKLSPKKKQKQKEKRSDKSSILSISHNIETKSTSQQLQRVFHYFDKNGDGKVSPAELRSCVMTVGGGNEKLSLEEAEGAISKWDMDGDGLLEFDEFEKIIIEEEENLELREAFNMYEMEGSGGCITPTSLKRMLNRLGEPRSLEDCKSIIRFFDLNGDGVLCFHEFATMMH